ncbi:MAG: phage tail protein [Clostridiales bacterium]|nr:phage tail protein [Clostridiales bacterium]
MLESGKRIYLCQPGNKLMTQLNGVQIDTVQCSEHLKDFWELSFVVDRYIATDEGAEILSNGYEDLGVYMELYLEDIGYFQMQEPVVRNDGFQETKSIQAYDISKEFQDKALTSILINKGTTDSLEYLAKNNVDELGFAKKYIILYRSDNPELSLLHLMLEKMPGWKVGFVSEILKDNEAKRMSVEADNTNIYAFLTSVVAPKLDLIFRFDILNKTINVYDKEEIGKDTTVFIGYRNLAKAVEINCDEDSVFTQFTVTGDDDLDIRAVNFNERWIQDLSFFMNEKYMSSELIEKLKAWTTYREKKRPDFIELSTKGADLESKIQDVAHRAPNDGCDWKQWDDMTEELLNKNMKYYNALLTSLQVSVDPDPQYTNPTDGTDPEYIPWKKIDGTIDHERYLDLLYKKANGYGGYYTYIQVKDYILPNIQIAIDNLLIPDKEDKHDYNKEFETNWDLYGVELLKAKKENYENLIKTLEEYKKPWNELTDDEKAKHPSGEEAYNIEHNKYVEYSGYLGSETTQGTLLFKLKQLTDEIEVLKTEQKGIADQKTSMIEDVSIENEKWKLSDDEYIIYNTLIHDQTYTNSNIVSTSIDSTLDTIKVQETLYQDAIDKISELSQPQYTFTTEMDNLLRLEEFKCWRSSFVLGNFVRLGIRDDYSVKLRLIGRTWNPCAITPDLTVEFSNMITSRSGRNDLTQILQNENERGSSGGGVALGTGNSKDDKEYLTTLLQKMISNNLFNNAVTNITGNLQVPSATIQKLVGEYLRFAKIDVGQINGDEASFNKFFSEYIDADYIAARIVIGDIADFKEIKGDLALLKKVVTGQIIGDEAFFIELTSGNVHISDAVIKEMIAAKISVADLMAHAASAEIITLISSDTGQPSIAFANGTQQFYDDKGNIRVQIGQDVNGDFNFIVRGVDGKTALFDENGITTEGIQDGLIKNDMLADNQISKNKLNFPIVKTDENGKVSITEILDGNGDQFGIKYQEFQDTITSTTTNLDKKIEDSLQYKLEVSSSNGNIFTNGQIDTYLTVTLYRGNNDVTNDYPDSHFIWSRQSSDSDLDDYWNSQHTAGSRTLHITREDIFKKAQFRCSFILDDEVAATTTS